MKTTKAKQAGMAGPLSGLSSGSPGARIERDTMGELAVPLSAYYGVQTARAIENFPISSLRFPRAMIRAMGLIKRAAASVNHSLNLLDKKSAGAIKQAATEVVNPRCRISRGYFPNRFRHLHQHEHE